MSAPRVNWISINRRAGRTLGAASFAFFGLLSAAYAEHQDVAPLPADVVEKLTHRARQAPQRLRSVVDLEQSVTQLSTLAAEDEAAEQAADSTPAAIGAASKAKAGRLEHAAERRQARRMLYEGGRAQLAVVRRNVIEEVTRLGAVAQSGSAASDANLPPNLRALGSQGGLIAQINQRFDRLDRALAAVDASKDVADRRQAVRRLRAELQSLRGPQESQGEGPISNFRREIETRTYRLPAAGAPRYATSAASTSSARSTQILALPVSSKIVATAAATSPAIEAACGSTAADLAETPDAPQSEDITTLANQLGRSPLKIFQYVYNEIEFQPYYGALKGASATLQSRSGGPTDQASLLIALLRASGYPARYVAGRVGVADTDITDGGRVGRWLGVKSYGSASSVLSHGRFNAETFGWPVNGVAFNHVWVEACVPYAHYRGGAQIDNAGARWIPLDPSFKLQEFKRQGPLVIVNLDEFLTNHLKKRRNGPDSLVEEDYAQQMLAAARDWGDDPNATLEDLLYKGTFTPLEMDILPSTLPYDVVQYNAWSGVTPLTSEVASLPAAHRYKLYMDGVLLQSPFSVFASDVALKRITLGFEEQRRYFLSGSSVMFNLDAAGAVAIQQTYKQWRTDGQSGSSLPCRYVVSPPRGLVPIYVMPVISIDGVRSMILDLPAPSAEHIPTGYPLGYSFEIRSNSMLEVCSTSNQLKLSIGLAEQSGQTGAADNFRCIAEEKAPGQINCVQYNNIAAHNLHALEFNLFQVSDSLLNERTSGLIGKVAATPSPNNSDDALEQTDGEFLHLVGMKYMRYVSDAMKRIGRMNNGTGDSGLHIGLTSSLAKVQYIFDIPYAIAAGGFLIDMPGVVLRDVAIHEDYAGPEQHFHRFLLSGFVTSAYESYVWQENARMDAISTVRGLQFANEFGSGIGSVKIAPGEWVAKRPQLVSSGANGYPTSLIGGNANESSTIKGLLDAGQTVIMPKSLITYGGAGGWKGYVYASYGLNDARFAINRSAGGYAVGAPLNVGGFTSQLDYSYLSPPPILPAYYSNPVNYNPINVFDTAPVGWMPASNGITPASTFAGDPVNLVTGNFYHNEVDIKIKGRGGLPIVFARAYNSRNPQDGPLGFGWTHSFDARLKFYGAEGDASNNSILTAKVSWIDGTGAEKFFSSTNLNGATGQINANAVLDSPTGVYVKFIRDGSGNFSIREKDGLTYVFSFDAGVVAPNAAPGTSTTPTYAKLRSMTDRNGNAVVLNYAPNGQLASVADSLGRTVLTFTWTGSRITEVRDYTSRVFKYEYTDGNGNLTAFKNPLAAAGTQAGTLYSYYTAADGTSLPHLMRQYTLPRGNGMRFEYYANGRVFRHTAVRTDGSLSPDQASVFSYNDFRRETLHTDERGGEHRYFFDPFGNTIKVIGPGGTENVYAYDCKDPTKAPGSTNCLNPHNRSSETNPAGHKTEYRYTQDGNVDRVAATGSGAISESYDFNAFGSPRRVKDPKGRWTILRYDSRGNLLDSIRMGSGYNGAALSCAAAECAFPTDTSLIRTWVANAYDSSGNLTSSKTVRDFAAQLATNTALSNTGPITAFDYDASRMNLVTVRRIGIKNDETTASTVNTATLGYDDLNRQKIGVDGNWYSVSTHFDDLDRTDKITDSMGKLRDIKFDANGNRIGQSLKVTVAGVPTVVDSSSARVDDSDRVIASTDAGGFVTSYVYDAAGNPIAVTNPDSYVLKTEYDEAGRPFRVYDQQGNAVVTLRDTSGRTRSVTDPNGNVTNYAYWDASKGGRLRSVTSPRVSNNGSGPSLTSGRIVSYDYDALTGKVTRVTDTPAEADGLPQPERVTQTAYDDMDRPVRIVGPQFSDPSRGSICPLSTQGYDSLGRLNKVRTGHTPSPCSLVASGADVLVDRQSYSYDDFGRKISSTDELGRTWRFKYDANNNLREVTDPKQQKTTYTWLRTGKLLTREQQGGRKTTYVYDDLGLTMSVFHPEVNYAYGYDQAHRPIYVIDSRGGRRLEYAWSPGGLLDKVSDNDGRQTSYLYDKTGRMIGLTAPNGNGVAFQYDAGGRLLQRWMPNGVKAQYAYNEDNSLRQIVNRNRADAVVSQHDYAYDGVGRRIAHAEAIGGSAVNYAYAYDELNRLVQVNNGSPAALEKYTYDLLNNRLTRSTGTSGPSVVVYNYDGTQLRDIRQGTTSGALIANYQHDTNGNVTSDGTRTYTWDDLDQLVQISSAAATVAYSYDGAGRRIRKVVGGQTTQWTYDGQDIHGEYGASWGQPSALYTGSGATDDPLIRAAVTGPASYGEASYYHADGLGSVVGLSSSTAATSQTQRFNAWGARTQGNVPQGAQFGFTGREPDETGLVHMRARYYDPALGRFVSRDPAGLSGGLNAYAYCGNNPVNCTDPSGMLPADVLRSLPGSSYLNQISDALGMQQYLNPFYAKDTREYAEQKWEYDYKQPDASQMLDAVLSVTSAIPGLGTASSLVGMVVEGYRGNYGSAAMYAVSAVPFAGTELGAARSAVRAETRAAESAGASFCRCCFAAGTSVLTADGLRPIEQIQVGDQIQSRDEATGRTALKPVTALIHHDARHLYGLTLLEDKGRVTRLEVSDNHPFWVKGRGWVESAKLQRGMKLQAYDKSIVTVANVADLGREAPTFNLTVADFHTFFAGESKAFVHNACACTYALPMLLGQGGEERVRAVYDIGPKPGVPIQMNGRERIPDGLTGAALSEVKNVGYQSYTQQLRDYLDFAQAAGIDFDLYLRSNTKVSSRLQDQITSGFINRIDIP